MRSLQLTLFISGAIFCALSFAETRESCRASTDQEKIISCIEQRIYDPCDDAGGSWGRAQCAWAHAEIAERKIKRAEEEIRKRLGKSGAKQDVLARFTASQEHWRKFREAYCHFTNQADDLSQFSGGSFFHLGYCWRRLSEQRSEELATILQRDE